MREIQLKTIIALAIAASPVNAATFVYVGNADSQDITVLELAANGDLRPVATAPVPGPAKPGGSLPLAVSPDKRFLFAALRNEPYSVVTFSIDAKSGMLNAVGSGALADSMAYIVTDRTGHYLLSASYSGSRVTVNPIEPNGRVGPVQQSVATAPKAHAIVADPQNRHVLHTSLGGDVIHQEKFDAHTGRLTPNDPGTTSVEAQAGPRHLVFSPNGEFVYLLNELDASIYVFPYDSSTGTLKKQTQIVSSLPRDFAGKRWAADIHVTPNGRFLYASERTASTLAAFAVNPADGTLTSTGSFPTARQPRAFNIDPSSRFLLAVGQLSNSVTVHAIDPASGALTVHAEYPVGKNPNWVEVVRLP
jgi:6-phosphogluconolactonase